MDGIFAHIVFADYGGETIRRIPFLLEKINPEGVCGYQARLPITGAEATGNKTEADIVIRRAMAALASMDVSIVLPPEGFHTVDSPLAVARGTDVLPFFLPRAIKKALVAVGHNFALCEITVLCGDSVLAARVLEQLSHEASFRYITVVGTAETLDPLRAVTARIFTETGLNIALSEQTRHSVTRAHVVLHTTPPDASLTPLYRKNALCFDLSGSRGMTAALLARRGDMLAMDGLYASLGKTTFPQDVLALVLYGKSPAFARLVREGSSPALADAVRADIAKLRVTVSAYAQAGRALSVAALTRRAAGL